MNNWRKRFKEIWLKYNNYRQGKIPFLVWLMGFFVGLRKELMRTKWLTGKPFVDLFWKTLLVIVLLAGTLFFINYGIVSLFGETGIL